MTGRVLRLMRIERNVADLPRAVAFYRDALGFAVEGADWQGACLRLGAQQIALRAAAPTAAPYPAGSGAADLWFQHFAIVTGDLPAAYDRLRGQGMTAITHDGPQRLPPQAGGVTAFKFRDPEGHPLELIGFPPGRNPAWPAATAPTLGIDHSALSVGDVERSIAFYAGLGLSVTARQVNSGPAQERLDGLADVAVDVVALAPASTPPHVELLAYRNPRGRMAQPDIEPGDIAADRLVLLVDTLDGLADLSEIQSEGGSRQALRRDPDGHWLMLVEA